MNRTVRTILVYALILVVVVFGLQSVFQTGGNPDEISLDSFMTSLEAGEFEAVRIRSEADVVEGFTNSPEDPADLQEGIGADVQATYPDGFEEIEQGWSVTPRWPVEVGEARLELRPKAERT